jgi:hypothetical protein
MVLLYLEGLSHEEVARHMGCPVGTVKTRLVRGRRLLRDRLDRRGLGAALLLLAPRPAPAAIPDALADSTARAMMLARAGDDIALRLRYPRAATLADAALRAGPRQWLPLPTLLVLLALTAALTVGALLAPRATANDDLDSLPASLTDILNIRCR